MNAPDSFRYLEADSGCWIWQGYIDPNGYGRIYNRVRKRIEWAHRYSYERHKGPIADKHEIDHTCQTTACVNPSHLDQVTKSEHARRTMQRLGKDELHAEAGRLRRSGLTYAEIAEALRLAGVATAFAAVQAAIAKGLIDADDLPQPFRLTDSERHDIKLMYAFGFNQTVIAEIYGIDSSHVSRICNGRPDRRRSHRKGAA